MKNAQSTGLKKFFQMWSTIWTAPLGLLIFWYSPYIIHIIDPTAEVLTMGQYQKITFAVSASFIFDGLSWIFLKLNFPALYEKYKSSYGDSNSLQDLSPWEVRKYRLFVLSLYLIIFALLTIAASL